MSTSMAIIVTRAASTGNLGSDVTTQILAYPKMLYVTGVTIFLLGLFTPIPNLVTIPISGLLLFGAGYNYGDRDVGSGRKGTRKSLKKK